MLHYDIFVLYMVVLEFWSVVEIYQKRTSQSVLSDLFITLYRKYFLFASALDFDQMNFILVV